MARRFALLGEAYAPEFAPKLEKLGFRVLTVPENPRVAAPLRHHADLSVFISGREVVLARHLANSTLEKALQFQGFSVSLANAELGEAYSADTALCACPVGTHLICREKSTDLVLKSELLNFSLLNVKQGYAKCSVCPVGGTALITSDGGIAKAAQAAGLEVLLVRPGFVHLDGYDTGFIGGASGAASDCVLFTGTLAEHPDGEPIAAFIRQHGKTPIALANHPLRDIGSILTAEL